MGIAEFAFRIGRRIGKHPVAGRLFCLTERWLPVDRIARQNGIVAFHHPRPIADPHVLIVPTRPVSSITTDSLGEVEMAELIWGMVELGREATTHLPANDHWRFVINGGTRQDIGQMHAHLMHADSIEPAGLSMESPAIELDTWAQLLANLRAAELIPGNGFSLEIRWLGDQPPRAEVTQSMST